MSQAKEKCVNLQRVEGGFIITTDVGCQVTPSLQKAFKIAREYMIGDATTEASEE